MVAPSGPPLEREGLKEGGLGKEERGGSFGFREIRSSRGLSIVSARSTRTTPRLGTFEGFAEKVAVPGTGQWLGNLSFPGTSTEKRERER